MDESWDADFDGDLKVPDAVRGASASIKTETQAAKQLEQITRELRADLLQNPTVDHGLLVRAMAIVHASITNEKDEIYHSTVWDTCRHSNLEVAGDSIEDVLREAADVREKLRRSTESI